VALTINQDVKVGGSVYHVQTEYYKTSGNVVSSIFKDGVAVKTLKKQVGDLPEEELDQEVKSFHNFVISRLTGTKAVKEESKPESLLARLPEETVETLIKELHPVFGVAANLVVEDILSSATTADEALKLFEEELPADAGAVLENIREMLDTTKNTVSMILEKEGEILKLLGEYFGVVAGLVFSDALEESAEGGFEGFVEAVISDLEGNQREELKSKLLDLYKSWTEGKS